MSGAAGITVRTDLRPGDLGRVILLHGEVYARECGFDATFEAYGAGPIAEFALSRSERERIWIAERGDRLVGSIAIVSASTDVAQLRWFLVDPGARGHGLGTRLLNEAVAFSRAGGYGSILLWTVGALEAAASLYKSVGFRETEANAAVRWGTEVIEQRYELDLS